MFTEEEKQAAKFKILLYANVGIAKIFESPIFYIIDDQNDVQAD